jgi:uncharacterized membrane protein HdeD (DUF308 family)
MIKKTEDGFVMAVSSRWMNRYWWKVMAVCAVLNGVVAATGPFDRRAVISALVGVACIVCAVHGYGWKR